ncbi:hypothetical protein K0M31_014234 [Melipona bicolor]|uniref:Uncharacterized protein n=1 Tax=Melipona bicolor TaxID=60889 RepID=A0AA40G8D3_9HYME|nr:hypothetical protein K0M31_014234 [Melipona bicolor]
MRDTTATGPGARARRRPRSPGSSFRIIRVRHEAARKIVLPVLTTMSFVPQFHVMLEHAIARTHLEHIPSRCKERRERKKKEEDPRGSGQRAKGFEYRESREEHVGTEMAKVAR